MLGVFTAGRILKRQDGAVSGDRRDGVRHRTALEEGITLDPRFAFRQSDLAE